jgi:predicted nucleic acid-binding Zn ribbon protein
MQDSDENARRLERINRNLMMGVVVLVIVVVLLAIIDFA